MKIAITGATGLIGKALSLRLMKSGHRVTALVRDPAKVEFLPKGSIHVWKSDQAFSLEKGLDAFIHLAGEPVAGSRWSVEQKERILHSRIESTKNVIASIRALEPQDRPRVLVLASAIGIYGDRGDEELSENSEHGSGFLAEVTKQWEQAADEARTLGIRVVFLRTGVVLAREGGALSKMLPVVLGSGKQWMSWIHLEDELGIIEFAIQNTKVEGKYNLVSPSPVTNHDFCEELAAITNFPILPKVPAFIIKIALGEMSQIILASQKVSAKKILNAGYQFKFAKLNEALTNLFPDHSYLSSYFGSEQFVPSDVGLVFSFFSRAENLEEITPPWLNFKIIKKSTAEITEQTKIDYRLKIHGFPVRWRTNIESWVPGVKFVDDQIKGPYSKWHHEHQFFAVEGGTLMSDAVTYRVPGWALGKMFLGSWIRADIQKIFAYRTKVITEKFEHKKNG